MKRVGKCLKEEICPDCGGSRFSEAIKFYELMGFRTYNRTDRDEQDAPYTLCYMKLEKYHKIVDKERDRR